MEGLFDGKNEINKALEELFPRKITKKWIEGNFGKASWEYDVEALQKALAVPIWNFLDRGGKRWRPLLMLLCCEAVGGNPDKIIKFAAIPEFIHNGTLIIDDIEDNSDFRRGKPVLHKLFGMDITVNAGNTMYYLPFLLIEKSKLSDATKRRMYDVITIECLKCHLGQATDIYWHNGKKSDIKEGEYLQMCANKSGVLARISAKLGAILGGAGERQVFALGRFGETLGVVFQIQDDILNITQSKSIGKEEGDDINEGKRTLMVLHVLKVGSKKDKKRLVEILEMHTNDENLIREAISIIKRYDSINYAKKVANGLMNDAWSQLSPLLKDSAAKKKLKKLADFLIERSM